MVFPCAAKYFRVRAVVHAHHCGWFTPAQHEEEEPRERGSGTPLPMNKQISKPSKTTHNRQEGAGTQVAAAAAAASSGGHERPAQFGCPAAPEESNKINKKKLLEVDAEISLSPVSTPEATHSTRRAAPNHRPAERQTTNEDTKTTHTTTEHNEEIETTQALLIAAPRGRKGGRDECPGFKNQRTGAPKTVRTTASHIPPLDFFCAHNVRHRKPVASATHTHTARSPTNV